MTKKVKSFTVDEEAYNALGAMFKEYGAESSISSCLDKHIKELLEYFRALGGGLGRLSEHNVPMSFVIDSFLKAPVVDRVEREANGEPIRVSVLKELDRWQDAYDEEMRKNIQLTLDSGLYKEFSDASKEYGASDVVNFVFKVLLEQTKRGRELTEEEYRAVEDSMGESFRKYRRRNLKPKAEKVGDGLDKLLKVFGLKVDRADRLLRAKKE